MIHNLSALLEFAGLGVAAVLLLICILLVGKGEERLKSLLFSLLSLGYGALLVQGLSRQSCGLVCRLPTWGNVMVEGLLLAGFLCLTADRLLAAKGLAARK